jgi:hypothetical protein
MRVQRGFVVLLQASLEHGIVIHAPVDDGTLLTLDDGSDVLARHRLVRLHRVRECEHEDAVLFEEHCNLVEELLQPSFHTLTEFGLEPHAVGAGLDALLGVLRLGDAVRRDGGPHGVEGLHFHRHRRRVAEVAADTDRVVAIEEHALTGE